MRRRFTENIHMLRSRQVDIPLGNHPPQNKTLQKRRRMLEDPSVNPFIDPAEWGAYLDKLELEYREFLNKGY